MFEKSKINSYEKSFVVLDKNVTVFVRVDESILHKYENLFDRINNLLLEILDDIVGFILKNPHVIKNSCFLDFVMIESENIGGSFYPTLSNTNEKIFGLNFDLYSFEEDKSYIENVVIHELAHAFDIRFCEEYENIVAFLDNYIKNCGDVLNNVLFILFLYFARVEGYARINEYNNIFENDVINNKYGFYLSKVWLFKFRVEEIERVISSSKSVSFDEDMYEKYRKEFGLAPYSLGAWMYFLIQNMYLDKAGRLSKYYLLSKDDWYNKESSVLRYLNSNKIDFSYLYDVRFMSDLFNELNIKPIYFKNIKNYMKIDKKLKGQNDLYYMLKLHPDDLVFLKKQGIYELGSLELLEEFEKARKYFGLGNDYGIIKNPNLTRILKRLEQKRKKDYPETRVV